MAARLKKKRVNLEPPRPMAARLKKKKKKQRVNLEPPRPMAARLKKKTAGKPRTASAYGRAVKKQKVDYEPHRPTAARLIMTLRLRLKLPLTSLTINSQVS